MVQECINDLEARSVSAVRKSDGAMARPAGIRRAMEASYKKQMGYARLQSSLSQKCSIRGRILCRCRQFLIVLRH